jgi:hypothetical protein
MRTTGEREIYPERLTVLMPAGSKAALDSAAREKHTTMSELARQAPT